MELHPRILVIELLIGIFLVIQILLPAHFNLTSSVTGFCILTILKYNLEGFRFNYVLFVISQILALIPYSLVFYVLGLLLATLAVIYFPVYEYPKPSGPYKVGYRCFNLNGKALAAIYYPTEETTVDVRYTHNVDGWERFADIILFYAKVKKKKHAPKKFYKFILSFLEHQYLGVNLNAKIAQTSKSQKFPIILFSHGLAANIHVYSAINKEWASHGFIVISVDHDELIPLDIEDLSEYDKYVQMRAEQLLERKNLFSELLDFVSNSRNLCNMFGDENISIDENKIILAGHSFGGATACELAVEDKRVTGGLVLLDPWLDPCSEQVFTSSLDKPILLIRSESFAKNDAFKFASTKFVKANAQGNGLVISGFFKGSTHHYSSDLQLHIPREMMLFKMLTAMHDIAEQLRWRSALVQVFLDTIVKKGETSLSVKQTQTVKAEVLEKFGSYLKLHSKENILETDEDS